jgi:hypothetical protein
MSKPSTQNAAQNAGAFVSRTQELILAWNAGDHYGALRIAKTFVRLSRDDARRIRQAWEAAQRPSFYAQIGKRPDAMIADGLAALAALYDLTPATANDCERLKSRVVRRR